MFKVPNKYRVRAGQMANMKILLTILIMAISLPVAARKPIKAISTCDRLEKEYTAAKKAKNPKQHKLADKLWLKCKR